MINKMEQTTTIGLTELQKAVYKLNKAGYKQIEIAQKLNRGQSTISGVLRAIEAKGYEINRFYYLQKPIPLVDDVIQR